MKRNTLLLLLLLSFLPVAAKKVTVQQVKEAALSYFASRGYNHQTIRSCQALQDDASYYLVNMSPQGWAVIAGDDVIEPVIAYSLKGTMSPQEMPDGMQFMLDYTQEGIEQVSVRNQAPHPRWKGYTTAITRATGDAVEPLIKVNWNQSAPFNKYCPERQEVHALVGCVAVAMAQAMSVQRYPARPKGSISYGCVNYGGLNINFDAEKGYDWDAILSGSNNFDEVARLLSHAGLSVKMDYGEDSSGVLVSNLYYISDALNNNFSYETAQYHWRDRYAGDWEQMIINELVAGRAVIYNGVDGKNNAGHSFNIDGYDGNGHFHVNWGWGGMGNAYFLLDGLKYSNLHFSSSIAAITGIGGADQILKNISLDTQQIEEGLPAGSIVSRVLVNEEEPNEHFVLEVSGINSRQVPFIIENGLLKTTEVLKAEEKATYDLAITVTDYESGTSLKQIFPIKVEQWKDLGSSTSLTFDRTTQLFVLKTKHNVSYQLISASGSVIQQGELSPIPQLEIQAQRLPAGVNTLTLKSANETKSIQLIIRKEEKQ